MTEQEVQALAEKAQNQIEGAINNTMKARAGLCRLAAKTPAYGEAIKGANAVLVDLLNAHSDGIDALNKAPGDVIVPRFGSK